MQVEIVSDVVCPWCYIGKRRFEAALALLQREGPEVEISVTHRSFQLDPTAPLGAPTPVRDAYAKKFGGSERAERILATVTEAAASEGLHFRMDIAVRANTLRAHRVLAWVGMEYPARQVAVNDAIMAAYFTHGKDIADPTTLTDCVVSGVPELAIGAGRLHDVIIGEHDDLAAKVTGDLEWAAARDITAVPTFVLNDSLAVPGAQDASTLARIMRRMLSR